MIVLAHIMAMPVEEVLAPACERGRRRNGGMVRRFTEESTTMKSLQR